MTNSPPHAGAVGANLPRCLEASEIPPTVAVVVPCYNEFEGISSLVANLSRLEAEMAPRQLEVVFVDDGSTDATLPALREAICDFPNWRIVRHDRNCGIARATLTGIHAAKSDLVGAIDADCSYPPYTLIPMLEKCNEDVSLVTASPYHPDGSVRNVPAWRLWLSKLASRMYRLLLRQKLHTYTSCFRVYRRDDVLRLDIKNDGFVGITEILWQLDRRGYRIVEHPADLNIRLFGQSKMRVVSTMMGHFRLLCRAFASRLTFSQLSQVPRPNSRHRMVSP